MSVLVASCLAFVGGWRVFVCPGQPVWMGKGVGVAVWLVVWGLVACVLV